MHLLDGGGWEHRVSWARQMLADGKPQRRIFAELPRDGLKEEGGCLLAHLTKGKTPLREV